ncbi:hypothetical protein [Humibacter albus]|uniref:hypothetical protein n=1 Tax=Humibacter albus TaxID=427754 RepID=UPI0003B6EF68|nr:hypothetical protein [Humibacter albus]
MVWAWTTAGAVVAACGLGGLYLLALLGSAAELVSVDDLMEDEESGETTVPTRHYRTPPRQRNGTTRRPRTPRLTSTRRA